MCACDSHDYQVENERVFFNILIPELLDDLIWWEKKAIYSNVSNDF